MPTDARRASAALVALSVATFAYVTTEVLPIGLLPLIADGLHRTPAQVGQAVTGYAVVVVLASLPLTRLTVRVPRRPLLTVTLAVSAGATVVCAFAGDYRTLLVARLVVASGQALFWSIVGPTVAGLFAAQVRGRVLGRLAVGTSLAPVLGVPAGTWLGQQTNWRVAFLALSALLLATCAAVALLLPSAPARGEQAHRAPTPDTRRYAILVVSSALGVAGFETAFTYISLFLTRVSHFGPAALAPLLLVTGVAGVLGAALVGRHLDRRPWAAVTVPLALLTGALVALWAAGTSRPATVAALALLGFAFSAYAPAVQNSALRVAPGNSDVGAAGASTAFNVGIGGGSLLGGVFVDAQGVRPGTLAGAGLAALGTGLLLFGAGRRTQAPTDPTTDRPAARVLAR
jgi:predicted MFS family arabinose efflux permease